MTPFWTHPSVLKFAGNEDPVEAVLRSARSIVLEAIEGGWQGPPFDPFELARSRKIHVVPREDVDEAKIEAKSGGYELSYNPLRPRTRVRYSVAHEVAHTIFRDCAEMIRFRKSKLPNRDDDWQLETLCNLAAAEFLMPIGTFPEFDENRLSMDDLLAWRKSYGVSTEAMLLRLVHLSSSDLMIFSASTNDGKNYSLNYALTKDGAVRKLYGKPLRRDSIVSNCTAIGYTEKGRLIFPVESKEMLVECVGVAPYPGAVFPRVLGFARPINHASDKHSLLKEVRGDALSPRGNGPHFLVHIVNDKAASWGAGFAKQVAIRYPSAAQAYRDHFEREGRFRLGEVFHTTVAPNLTIFQLVAQHGYGDSQSTRLRYVALKECLSALAPLAKQKSATVHMPRIGTGFGGGAWSLIRELINDCLCHHGIPVSVYSLGDIPQQRPAQQVLFET